MTKVLLHKTYKARKAGVILDIPQGEADSLVSFLHEEVYGDVRVIE